MRFNALHLHMSAGDTGTNNIAAKDRVVMAMTGIILGSEIYILPFFTYRNPLMPANFYSIGIIFCRLPVSEQDNRAPKRQ